MGLPHSRQPTAPTVQAEVRPDGVPPWASASALAQPGKESSWDSTKRALHRQLLRIMQAWFGLRMRGWYGDSSLRHNLRWCASSGWTGILQQTKKKTLLRPYTDQCRLGLRPPDVHWLSLGCDARGALCSRPLPLQFAFFFLQARLFALLNTGCRRRPFGLLRPTELGSEVHLGSDRRGIRCRSLETARTNRGKLQPPPPAPRTWLPCASRPRTPAMQQSVCENF